jgi:hypothetical protein
LQANKAKRMPYNMLMGSRTKQKVKQGRRDDEVRCPLLRVAPHTALTFIAHCRLGPAQAKESGIVTGKKKNVIRSFEKKKDDGILHTTTVGRLKGGTLHISKKHMSQH